MRVLMSLFGVLAGIVLLVVSAAMNWRFGFSLGKTELDAQIYAAASAAADGLKALLPFFILWALRQKNLVQVTAGVLLWCVCSAYSLTSSLGFAALNRADTVGAREAQAVHYTDLRAELKRAREKLSWVPQHRSMGEVEADRGVAEVGARGAHQCEFSLPASVQRGTQPAKGARRLPPGKQS